MLNRLPGHHRPHIRSAGRVTNHSSAAADQGRPGAALGFGLDRWLGTFPWLFLVFFMVGGAAGVLNVYRLFNTRPGAGP